MRLHASVLTAILAFTLSPKPPKLIDLPSPRSASRQKVFSDAFRLSSLGEYEAARAVYQKAFQEIPPSDAFDRTSSLIGVGSCLLMTHQYSAALKTLAQADELATVSRLTSLRIIIASNRASIYKRMGDISAAVAAIEQIKAALLASREPVQLTQAASVLAGSDLSQALPVYFAAIEAASNKGDGMTEAIAWLHLGMNYMKDGQLGAADEALTEAFRLRVVNGRKLLQSCYYELGRVRRRQGRLGEALVLLSRAHALSGRPGAHIPLPYVHYEIARTHADAGDLLLAFREFEAALHTARELRPNLLTAETFRVSAETSLQEIFSEYVRAGMQHLRKTGDVGLARRMFEVSEESRAALFERSQATELPPEYWELLSHYQRILSVSVTNTTAEPGQNLTRLRIQLADMESRLGVRTAQTNLSHQISEKDSPGNTLSGVQRKLKSTEAVLSFHCAEGESYLWALTRDSFETHVLPRSTDIRAKVAEFRSALLRRDGSAKAIGLRLQSSVLPELTDAVRAKPEWILSLDGPLFDPPFAALPVVVDGSPTYIAFLHSLRSIPGALAGIAVASAPHGVQFASIADPLYNAADPRWGGNPPRSIAGQQLARLPGTAREAVVCARVWGSPSASVLLTGRAVNRASVLKVAAGGPAILHIAAHVMPHPKLSDQVLIGLGLQAHGDSEYLSPADIATAKLPVGLVTLSGCGSASGMALPGLGLFGLTRAWLLSGTSAVVATLWPIADDSGEILSAMYGGLRKNPGSITASNVAKALQSAQIEMAQSTDWRGEPAYWSAFTVAGKD